MKRAIDPQFWMRHRVETSELLTAVAVDDTHEAKEGIEHRIDVERTHYTSTGARYRVTYLGATLIEGARTPLFDACRVLLERGITGKLVMYSQGASVPRATVDIEEGSKLTVIENAKEGPRIGHYRPHPNSVGPDNGE